MVMVAHIRPISLSVLPEWPHGLCGQERQSKDVCNCSMSVTEEDVHHKTPLTPGQLALVLALHWHKDNRISADHIQID